VHLDDLAGVDGADADLLPCDLDGALDADDPVHDGLGWIGLGWWAGGSAVEDPGARGAVEWSAQGAAAQVARLVDDMEQDAVEADRTRCPASGAPTLICLPAMVTPPRTLTRRSTSTADGSSGTTVGSGEGRASRPPSARSRARSVARAGTWWI
jgi:hypothetical protein